MVKFYKKLQIIALCYGDTFNNTYYEFFIRKNNNYKICYNARNHIVAIQHNGDTNYRCADPKYYSKNYPYWNKKYGNKLEIKQLVNEVYKDLLKEEEQFANAGFEC